MEEERSRNKLLLPLKQLVMITAAVLGVAILLHSPTMAMEFRVERSPETSQVALFADGPIELGDAQKLRRLISGNTQPIGLMIIRSLGGSVHEAKEIATIVKGLDVTLYAHIECAQIVFPAGKYSMLTPGSLLGIHSCSVNGNRAELCNKDIADFVVSNGFPFGTVDMYMDLYNPSEMKWLSEIGARCFGYYHATGEPAPIHGGKKACIDGYLFTMSAGIKTRPYGPSFNCTKAGTEVEKLLCLDKELMASDSVLGRAYDARQKNSNAKSRSQLKSEQIEWIRRRNEKCSSLISDDLSFSGTRKAALCLFLENEARIYALIGFNPQKPL